ncbi:MAG: hypothetical protein DRP09_15190 [Candidatus Thorarchaeota archaeon]|nr:MAG: hypothetical protein DRP09_15190 [Candidatus Thorarchaeota archaeon]
MMPNFPFPNVEMVTKGNIAEVRLLNKDLAEMLKKAIESRGQRVKNVEIYPDAFVVVIDLSDLEQSLARQGLKVTIEPKSIEIIINRSELINAFVSVTNISQKGIQVIDEKDCILLRGSIVP